MNRVEQKFYIVGVVDLLLLLNYYSLDNREGIWCVWPTARLTTRSSAGLFLYSFPSLMTSIRSSLQDCDKKSEHELGVGTPGGDAPDSTIP